MLLSLFLRNVVNRSRVISLCKMQHFMKQANSNNKSTQGNLCLEKKNYDGLLNSYIPFKVENDSMEFSIWLRFKSFGWHESVLRCRKHWKKGTSILKAEPHVLKWTIFWVWNKWWLDNSWINYSCQKLHDIR